MATKRLKQIEEDNNSINNGDETDRLTTLPDALIHHIFSFISTLHVVQTCLCIKSLQHVWRSIPNLDFNDTGFDDNYPPDVDEFVVADEYPPGYHFNFYDFVNSVIHRRDNSQIEKLRICCGNLRVYDDSVSKINDYIISAMKRPIHALDLEVSNSYPYASISPFQMTRRILTCASLRELKLNLNGFRINFSTVIHLPLLQTLHLKRVKYCSHRQNEALFSQSPVLENLVIEYCEFNKVKPLKISAQQLKHLTIMGMLPSNTTISTPNLVSLRLRHHPLNRYRLFMDKLLESSLFFVDNLISLTKADVNVPIVILFMESCQPSVVTESSLQLIGVLQNAQSLTLSHMFIESYSFLLKAQMYVLEHIRIPFCNLKWLKVETSFFDSHTLVINTLLEHSPNIETLILEHVEEFDSPRSPCSSVRELEENELGFCYKLLHLKSVHFQNFKSGMNEVKFARFLLGFCGVAEVGPCCPMVSWKP